MNKTVLLILTVAIASLTGGCSFFSDFNEAKNELEEETSKPIPRIKASQPETETETAEAETTETEVADSEAKSEPTQTVAGLVPATDPDVRVRNSVRGRQDPFSVVTLIPKIEVEAEETKTTPQQPRVTNRTNRERLVVNRNRNNRTASQPKIREELQTKLAQQVIVSGLYESRNGTKLIVQAPEENNSRYVEVGQYLSNGQILVKRIDRNHFPTPLVVLEQSGVEVTKTIGENPSDSKKITSLPPASYPSPELASNLAFVAEGF